MASADVHTALPGSFTFYFSGAFEILKDTGSYVCFRDNDTLLKYSTIFESLSIVEGWADISVPPADAGYVRASFLPSSSDTGKAPTMGMADLASTPFATHAHACTGTSVQLRLRLPSGHHFGHELKGSSLGNEPPSLCVRCEGFPASFEGRIKVLYSVRIVARGRDAKFAPPN